MAASPKHRRQQSSSSSSRARQPTARPHSSLIPPPIPKGPCNWRNLQQGSHANVCGCRRFWPQAASAAQDKDFNLGSSFHNVDTTSCFCGHHACFHAEFEEHALTPAQTSHRPQSSRQEMSQAMLPPGAAQYHESGRRSRANSVKRHVASASQRPPFDGTVSRDSLFGEPGHPIGPMSTAVRAQAERPKSAMSGLGLYLEQTRNQPLGGKLSAAAQSAIDQLPATQTPSHMTATEVTSEHGEAIRASPSRAFAKHVTKVRSQPQGTGIPQPQALAGAHPDDIAQSATEMATPSIAGTPALRAADDVIDGIRNGVEILHQDVAKLQPSTYRSQQDHKTTSQISAKNASPNANFARDFPGLSAEMPPPGAHHNSIADLISHVALLRHLLAETPNLGISLANLGQRVDALETASFAHSAIDDYNDRFELFDGRILEIESRVDELEKSRQQLPNVNDSIEESVSSILIGKDSPTSVSEALQAHAELSPTPLVNIDSGHSGVANRSNAIQRLYNIERRLADIDATRRTPVSSTCTIEVILMPWGQNLKGIWSEPSNVSQGSGAGEHGVVTHAARPGPRAANERDALIEEWPYAKVAPRAIGPTFGVGGRIYERLKSRGFIKNVTILDASARHIYVSISEAFRDFLGHPLSIGPLNTPSSSYDERKGQTERPPLGLKGAFIPLRKIHKRSRLRFLSESELTTPTSWTLQFLESSIFMKAPSAGVTRLFITTPTGYLQHTSVPGWTWQKIRELPRVPDFKSIQSSCDDSVMVNGGVPEADAREPCWEHDPKLDPPRSQQSSFASNVSFESSHHPSPPQTKPDACDEESDSEKDDPNYQEPSEAEFEAFSSEGSKGEHRSTHPTPITPISDFPHSDRPLSRQQRTASAPIIEHVFSSSMPHIALVDQSHPKRQVASFDNVMTLSSRPEILVPHARPLSSTSKRRRLSRTPSGQAPVGDEAPWALTPGRSNVADSSVQHEDTDTNQDERANQVGVKVPLKDGGAAAYATPFSFSGPPRAQGDNDTDMDANDDAADDDEYHDSEGSEDEQDPASAYESSRSVESEAETDAAIAIHEGAWQGVDNDEFSEEDVELTRSKRQRVRHSRRKTRPRRKATVDFDVRMNDDEVDEVSGRSENAGYDDEEDENGDDSDDDDDYDELGPV